MTRLIHRTVTYLLLFILFSTIKSFSQEIFSLDAQVDKQTGKVTLNWGTSLENGYFDKYIYDDFETLDSKWKTRSGNWKVNNGFLEVTSGSHKNASIYFDQNYSNIIIETKMTKTQGDKDNVGIFFNGDPTTLRDDGNWQSTHKFIHGYGDYRINNFSSQGLENVTGWIANSELNENLGQWNVIELKASALPAVTVTINGVYQNYHNIKDAVPFWAEHSSGKVGLVMYDALKNGKAKFDYIKIKPINGGIEAFHVFRDNVLLESVRDFTSFDTPSEGSTYCYKIAAFDGKDYVVVDSIYVSTNDFSISQLYVNESPTNGNIVEIVGKAESNQTIKAVECFVDSIGENGTGYPLPATDGEFNSMSEEFYNPLIIPNLKNNTKHTIYAHAMNSDNTWSEFNSTTFFYKLPGSGTEVYLTPGDTVTVHGTNANTNSVVLADRSTVTGGDEFIQPILIGGPNVYEMDSFGWVLKIAIAENTPPGHYSNISVTYAFTDITGKHTVDSKDFIVIVETPASVSSSENNSFPEAFQLQQNYPNPFNPTTTIPFTLAKKSFVDISIYDINGRLVEKLIEQEMSGGDHRIVWNAKNNPTGTYFIKFYTDSYQKTHKCLLLK